ncbi:MAG TPA: hypothetical protein P5096_01340 [Patescibacteria group bacterium]|nr:hypothetical protein [Patescibacteria group bacterium]
MIDSEKKQNNIDTIQPAEKPKTLFESFWNRVLFLEMQHKIQESLVDRNYSIEKFENISAQRLKKEREFCEAVLNGFEKFIKNHDPKNSLFLWDIMGTIGIYVDDFIVHDSIEQLMRFIKSRYPELKMGVLTDCDNAFIKKIFETPKGMFLKKYIDPNLYLSVFEDDLGTNPEKAIHDYSNLLKRLGGTLNEDEAKDIDKVETYNRKKKIARLLESQGSNVFAVDDLKWPEDVGMGVGVNSMYPDYGLYD